MTAVVKETRNNRKFLGKFSFKNKWMEALVWLLAITVSVLVAYGAMALHKRYLEVTYPKSLVYGTWVESEVAPYAAETFVLSASGVVIDGGVVDTEFSFNGKVLEYKHGNQTKRFKFHMENWNEMELETDALYQPMFVKKVQK